jgi:hypothetical protein
MDRKCNIINENDCMLMLGRAKTLLTEERLIEFSNKGIYKRGLKDSESISDVQISFSDGAFCVEYDDIKAVIKKDLSDFSCSCKSKTVCRHVISSLIVLRDTPVPECEEEPEKDDKSDTDKVVQEPEESQEEVLKADLAYLAEVISETESIMKKGLINCGNSDREVLSKLSLKGENTIHNNISLMLRSLSSYIEEMLAKSADFSAVRSVHLICRIYNTARAIQINHEDHELISGLCAEGKEKYTEQKSLGLIGLGAYPWVTGSGYAGVTAIFWCSDDNRIYTYSSGISYIYENTKKFSSAHSLEELYRSRSHWTESVSISEICKTSFRLLGGRTSGTGRISSSKKTSVHPEQYNTYETIPLMNIDAADYSFSDDEYDYFGRRREEKVAAIRFEEFLYVSYNKIRQVLEFEITDGKKN